MLGPAIPRLYGLGQGFEPFQMYNFLFINWDNNSPYVSVRIKYALETHTVLFHTKDLSILRFRSAPGSSQSPTGTK